MVSTVLHTFYGCIGQIVQLFLYCYKHILSVMKTHLFLGILLALFVCTRSVMTEHDAASGRVATRRPSSASPAQTPKVGARRPSYSPPSQEEYRSPARRAAQSSPAQEVRRAPVRRPSYASPAQTPKVGARRPSYASPAQEKPKAGPRRPSYASPAYETPKAAPSRPSQASPKINEPLQKVAVGLNKISPKAFKIFKEDLKKFIINNRLDPEVALQLINKELKSFGKPKKSTRDSYGRN